MDTAHLAGVPFDDARARISEALKSEGFGILTEIDVPATLKAKLNRDFRRYVILGACNPQLAHRALEADLGIGLLLPCNVCVWEEDGGSVVSIARPDAMFAVVNREEIEPVAQVAGERLQRALEQVGSLQAREARPVPAAGTVDSGVAEVVRLQEAGWAYIKSGA